MCEVIKFLFEANLSNWIAALATLAIFILAIFQYLESKNINKIQKSLSALDFTPSLDLQYSYETGTLLVKNTGRSQLFFYAATTNTTGEPPQEITKKPDRKRIIAVNSCFPMAFDIAFNQASFVSGIKKDVSLYGVAYIENLQSTKYRINFTVKTVVSYQGGSSNPTIHAQGAWIEEIMEIKDFPWKS